MAAKTRTRTAQTHNCECAGWAIVETTPDAETEPTATYRTGCTATTRKTFAPGHDAKLKGMLIEAGTTGQQVRDPHGSILDPITAAHRFGFFPQVRKGIEDGLDKAAIRAARGTKTRKPATADVIDQALPLDPAPVVVAQIELVETPVWPQTARIKHGRWTYDATVTADGRATYTNRKGQLIRVAAGSWTRV